MENNNNVTNDKNDWRFRGQDEDLLGENLDFKKYKRHSETWDHDHCEFCWAKFSEDAGDLHEGYCTLDNYQWICEQCYKDFNYMFNWIINK